MEKFVDVWQKWIKAIFVVAKNEGYEVLNDGDCLDQGIIYLLYLIAL